MGGGVRIRKIQPQGPGETALTGKVVNLCRREGHRWHRLETKIWVMETTLLGKVPSNPILQRVMLIQIIYKELLNADLSRTVPLPKVVEIPVVILLPATPPNMIQTHTMST